MEEYYNQNQSINSTRFPSKPFDSRPPEVILRENKRNYIKETWMDYTSFSRWTHLNGKTSTQLDYEKFMKEQLEMLDSESEEDFEFIWTLCRKLYPFAIKKICVMDEESCSIFKASYIFYDGKGGVNKLVIANNR